MVHLRLTSTVAVWVGVQGILNKHELSLCWKNVGPGYFNKTDLTSSSYEVKLKRHFNSGFEILHELKQFV